MNANGKTVGSEIAERLRRFTNQLEELGDVSELSAVLTVRKVKLDLKPRVFLGYEIKAIREQLRISQPVLAEFLGVASGTVKDWEQDKYLPQGPACRVFEEISRDCALWSKRIRELASSATSA